MENKLPEYIIENEDDSLTVNLARKFKDTQTNIEVKQLVLQPLKAKHLKLLSEVPTFADLLNIAGKAASISQNDLDEMFAKDAIRLTEAVAHFLA